MCMKRGKTDKDYKNSDRQFAKHDGVWDAGGHDRESSAEDTQGGRTTFFVLRLSARQSPTIW